MASIKKKAKKQEHPPITIRSLSITTEDAHILDRIAQDASDYLGWTVSGSAIVRALLRQAKGQDGLWAREKLFPFIENEIQGGRVWGKKKGELTGLNSSRPS